ncbi:serine/threonine protein kinase [Planktothrix sp. FACHB-1355]|uniref:non-specific serine/threonine protein kinase n=1 Tax=Aerosakkonema funiforme FACHB-1375 TaxID=2949571 RepID=A0A926VGE5_9CYAN|nr:MULTISPECIES: serine/threonine-protein kinase [Oscillatoriales]MBD2182673.1 serine/threonine protein kinase [Aerosakkonema funiforme FACHB-1375]MBD3559770.1 serine/threonine protein kinase [Planktothrix sp. FACHB-1355]
MELLHQPQDIVAQRYTIIDILGQGGMGTTYEAEDLQTRKRVAIKALSLNRMADWKVLELFEREASVLSHLNHPAIPRYIDYFQVETNNNQSFYLVQELAEGRSLFSLVQSGWHATETEVRQLAAQILDVLSYLHALTPPVIHRDIKPHNIIRREDGQIFLVDFGSVKATYQNTITGGSTVVGTYGYMAPEQFRGQAFAATDLYGLGATLLFVLTHRSPAEFPSRQLKINFRSQSQFSSEFADWLDKLLEPTVENRFLSTKEALSVLKGNGVLVPKLRRPAGTRVALTKTDRLLVAEIPRQGWQYWDLFNFVSGLMWLAISSFLFSFYRLVFYSPFFWLFPLGAILLGMFGLVKLKDSVFKLLGRTKLEIDRQNFRLRWSFLGVFYQVQGRTQDIDRVEVSKFVPTEDELLAKLKGQIPRSVTACAFVEGVRTHRFGFWLTPIEKDWLTQEIAAFVKKPLLLR